MKKLSMRRIDLGAGYFRYEVLERNRVIATRVSQREYVAAFIRDKPGYVDSQTAYVIDRMFGREDLFTKAMAKKSFFPIYAIAELSK